MANRIHIRALPIIQTLIIKLIAIGEHSDKIMRSRTREHEDKLFTSYDYSTFH